MRLRQPALIVSIFVLCCALLSQCLAAAQNPHPSFEVASVKAAPGADPSTGSWSRPGTGLFTASHLSLRMLIQLAYNLDRSQIANGPAWLDTELFDVVAKPEDGIELTREELRPRLQDLLARRFHLVAHMETHTVRGYALVVAKGGPHLTPTVGGHFPGFRTSVSPGEMRGFNWSMPQFATYLTSAAGFPVADQTGISGSYDVAFSYSRNPEQDSSLPPLEIALKDATGLMLKPTKVPVPTLVIDSVERVPTSN